jgi:hypothetical protein
MAEAESSNENPAWLFSAPEGAAPPPPVNTRASELPFTGLGWENFERLCCRLAEHGGKVEGAWTYGKSGHTQHGIDILVRLNDGTYEVWQSKRYTAITPGEVKAAVQFFLDGKWVSQAKRFVLAVACPLSSPGVVDALEEARTALTEKGINFDPLDAGKLTERLRTEPEIVDDFFDRPWVERICPREALEQLVNRLSRFAFASVRTRLRDFYRIWIATVDPGLPIAAQDHQGRLRPSIPLEQRYVQPDLFIRVNRGDQDSTPSRPEPATPESTLPLATDMARGGFPVSEKRTARVVPREQRTPLESFLNSERRALIVAEAGAGKSTLLRFLAWDILADNPRLRAVHEHYANHLPVWVPFALWARMAINQGVPPPIEDVVAAFFGAHNETALGEDIRRALNGKRFILLVDGLDETPDLTAAQMLLGMLTAFVERRNIPMFATSRPHGARGMWPRIDLAPLSENQGRTLAKIWFQVLAEMEADRDAAIDQLETHAERRAERFMEALKRSPGIARLAQTPLFLLALMDLHRQGHELPRSRFAASEKIIEQLVEHQPNRRATESAIIPTPGIDRRLRDRLMADFAYGLHTGELAGSIPDAATEEAAIARATALILDRSGGRDTDGAESQAQSIFRFSEERAGLLVKKAHENIGFLHLALQEYLVARHLAQRSASERFDFVRQHADKARWREPILYLLYLIDNEQEVGKLIEAIETARVAEIHGQMVRDALLADAVFADFAHNLGTARRIAERFFTDIEAKAWGEPQRHLLTAVVNGLFSEALAQRSAAKISEWIPDRHGNYRASAFQAMANWDESLRPICIPVLLRALHTDEYVWRPAAITLAGMTANHDEIKPSLQQLVKRPPCIEVLQAALFALGYGWSRDGDVARLAEEMRHSPHLGLCTESLRIRARRDETDETDLQHFCSIAYGRERFLGNLFAPDLVQHFSRKHRSAFVKLLEWGLKRSQAHRFHQKIPLLASLLYCDPDHSLVDEALRDILREDWTWHEIFGRSPFPTERIRWTPELISLVEQHFAKESPLHAYEAYWVAKAIRLPSLKGRIIDFLRNGRYVDFWASDALVEFWGRDDPEVREVLLPFAERTAHDIATVAEALQAVMDDRDQCRKVLIKAVSGSVERLDFLVSALKQLGVTGSDDEAFSACLSAGTAVKSPLYHDMWRARMLDAFPNRPEIRQMALDELLRRDGNMGVVANSYANDREVCMRLLSVLGPLPEEARSILVTELQSAACSGPSALSLLEASRDDTNGNLASEATIGWVEARLVQGNFEPQHVDALVSELDSVGPDFEQRRAAALVGLTLSGNINRFTAAVGTDGTPEKLRFGSALSPGANSYLDKLLPHWQALIAAFGSEDMVFQRLELSAETSLRALNPGIANAEHLLDVLIERSPSPPDYALYDRIAATARFAPRGDRMRQLIAPLLLDQHGGRYRARSNAEYWANMVAAEIFAEYFLDDLSLRSQVVECFSAQPDSFTAAAGLAELVLRRPDADLDQLLRTKSEKLNYDLGTHYKLIAAISSADYVCYALEKLLNWRFLDTSDIYLPYWVPAMLRRIEKDKALQEALYDVLARQCAPSVRVSFLALLGRASADTPRLHTLATEELEALANLPTTVIGLDITTGNYRPYLHILTELIN